MKATMATPNGRCLTVESLGSDMVVIAAAKGTPGLPAACVALMFSVEQAQQLAEMIALAATACQEAQTAELERDHLLKSFAAKAAPGQPLRVRL